MRHNHVEPGCFILSPIDVLCNCNFPFMPDDETTDQHITVSLSGDQKEMIQEAYASLQEVQRQINEEQETLDMIFSVIVGGAGADGPVSSVSLSEETITIGEETVSLTPKQADRIRTHRENIQELQPIQEKRSERLDDVVTLILDLEDIEAEADEVNINADSIEVRPSQGLS